MGNLKNGSSVWIVVMVFIVVLLFHGHVSAATSIPANYGAKGALADSSITLEKALTYAIEDEYLAQAKYDAVISKFGSVRPFTQIKAAEQRHISALLSLFQRYNLKVPEDRARQYVQAPPTVRDALQDGIKGETDNIAMYKKLESLSTLPEEARIVMTRLGDASQNHLAAFQRRLNQGR